jgi:integrase
VKHVGLHTLRHSAAVAWLESGVHIKAVADLLGHSSIRGVGTIQAPNRGVAVSDKSPRQTMTKKSGKSLKEKRAAKHAKAKHASSTEALLNVKKR